MLFRSPHYLSRTASTANAALSKAEETINKRVMDKIVEGMKNGQSANKLLAGLSPAQKLELSKFAQAAPQTAAWSGSVNAIANALAEQSTKEKK